MNLILSFFKIFKYLYVISQSWGRLLFNFSTLQPFNPSILKSINPFQSSIPLYFLFHQKHLLLS